MTFCVLAGETFNFIEDGLWEDGTESADFINRQMEERSGSKKGAVRWRHNIHNLCTFVYVFTVRLKSNDIC